MVVTPTVTSADLLTESYWQPPMSCPLHVTLFGHFFNCSECDKSEKVQINVWITKVITRLELNLFELATF